MRDTDVSEHIRTLYNSECQVCGIVLETPGGRYADTAHVEPLGKPENGSDATGNRMCVCPNHHLLFDRGAASIARKSITVAPL